MTGRSAVLGAVLALALFGPSAPAAARPEAPAACSINETRDDRVAAAMGERPYAFAGYETLCRFLKERGLSVDLAGDSGVLSGRSYGWVYVRLVDRTTRIASYGSSFTTVLNAEASTPKAEEAMRQALNGAMATLASNPQFRAQLVEQIATETARLRRVLAKP